LLVKTADEVVRVGTERIDPPKYTDQYARTLKSEDIYPTSDNLLFEFILETALEIIISTLPEAVG